MIRKLFCLLRATLLIVALSREKLTLSISLAYFTTKKKIHSWQSLLQPIGRAKSLCNLEGQMF